MILKKLLLMLLVLALLCQCNRTPPEDPRIAQMQKDVDRLSAENQQLRYEIENLRQEIIKIQDSRSTEESQSAPAESAEPAMTVDKMKKEVAPLLMDAIQNLRAKSDTPKKGKQFGKRTEYDLEKAVYGLKEGLPPYPYEGKVIVAYQRFLESDKESKLYGKGTTQFTFVLSAGVWTLRKIE